MINYDAISGFIGEPWVYLENDCWNLFKKASLAIFGREVYELKLPDNPSYKSQAKIFTQEKKKWIKIEKPEPGCAVLFVFRKHAIHIGLYIEKSMVLHSDGWIDRPGFTKLEKLREIRKRFDAIEYYKYADN